MLHFASKLLSLVRTANPRKIPAFIWIYIQISYLHFVFINLDVLCWPRREPHNASIELVNRSEKRNFKEIFLISNSFFILLNRFVFGIEHQWWRKHKTLLLEATEKLIELFFFEKRALLFNCTVCALYPSLFVSNLPSSSTNSIELDDLENEVNDNQLTLIGSDVESSQLDENSFVKMSDSFMLDEKSVHSRPMYDLHAMNNLETTSEGLCDYVREIFNLSRSVFNEYQMKAVRKLLTRKSHAQILKEELRKQHRLIQTDRHPIYKLQNFQVFYFFFLIWLRRVGIQNWIWI